jgi:hypothetical protein
LASSRTSGASSIAADRQCRNEKFEFWRQKCRSGQFGGDRSIERCDEGRMTHARRMIDVEYKTVKMTRKRRGRRRRRGRGARRCAVSTSQRQP